MRFADRHMTQAVINCRCALFAGLRVWRAMVSAHPSSFALTPRLPHRNTRSALGALLQSGRRGWCRCRRVHLGRVGLPNRICRCWRAAWGDDRHRDNSSRTHECAHREAALSGRPMHHCRVADRQARPQTICKQCTAEFGRHIAYRRAGNLASGRPTGSTRRMIGCATPVAGPNLITHSFQLPPPHPPPPPPHPPPPPPPQPPPPPLLIVFEAA
jgi:hypothetical protein